MTPTKKTEVCVAAEKESTRSDVLPDIIEEVIDKLGEISKFDRKDMMLKDECKASDTTDESEHEPQHSQMYLDQLVRDRDGLRQLPNSSFQHVSKLIDREISRVLSQMTSSGSSSSDEHLGDKVTLSETIMVPVDKYPRYNFVGRILGPRGMTAKQLEEDTGCKIMVRGRGSSRMYQGSRRERINDGDSMSQSGRRDRERGNDGEPLHVLIQCEDYESRAHSKMKVAIAEINQLLHPPPEGKDELKRKQLIELSIINGTYRPTTATKVALPAESPRPSSAAHLPSILDSPQFSDSSRYMSSYMDSKRSSATSSPMGNCAKRNEISEDQQNLAQMAQLIQILNVNNMQMQQAALNPAITAEYYKQLLAMSFDPAMLSAMMCQSQSMDPFTMMGHHQPGTIPQANMQQYLQAAALLSQPFLHDGAGDAPNKGKR